MRRERSELLLADLIELRAEKTPDLDVLTFDHPRPDDGTPADEVRTFAALHTNAHRIAAALIARGVAPGDRFAIMMRNHPEFVETMIAASIAGAVFVPIDPRTRGEKLTYMLRKAGCVGVVCADYALPALDAARADALDIRWMLAVESGESAPPLTSVPGVDALATVLTTPTTTVDVRAPGHDAPLQIMYTSGTTGDPKGIVGTNARFCLAGMLGALFGYRPDERPYTGLSLTHGNAQSTMLAPALTMSLRAVVSRRFTKSRLWDVCRRHGCTTFSLVGGMATAVYSEPARPDDHENPVRMVVSGGMPAAIWEPFEQRFGVRILEFYGAMDGGGMAYKPIGEGPIGSFGKPMPGMDMRILDANGADCPPGVTGEICCRPADGNTASVEYFGDPESSARKIRAGWNHSGDMGHANADGWLFFDYRAGGGIRHNGDFVHASFVEKAMAEHPAIADVFVYGVPAASGAPGEKDIVAAIVPVDPARLDVQAIFRACRHALEPNFVPSYLQVVDEIPKTASEKPQERLLAARFAPTASDVHRETPAGRPAT